MPWDAQAEYLAGLKGVYWDDAAHERLTQLILSHGQAPDAASTCRRYGLSGSGEGKLSMPFRIIETVFPGSLPASAQDRGDCVSPFDAKRDPWLFGVRDCRWQARRGDRPGGRPAGCQRGRTARRRAQHRGDLLVAWSRWRWLDMRPCGGSGHATVWHVAAEDTIPILGST
jgi:hypothetical protein